MKARGRAALTEQRNRAWAVWHTARLPMLKKFPPLEDLMPSAAGPKRAQTADEISTNMWRWRVVQQAAEDQKLKAGRG